MTVFCDQADEAVAGVDYEVADCDVCGRSDDHDHPEEFGRRCGECGHFPMREALYVMPNGVEYVDLVCDSCGNVVLDEEGGV